MAMSRSILALVASALAVSSFAEQPAAADDLAALSQGDECSSEGCALNALQRAGRKHQNGEAQDEADSAEDEGLLDLDVPPSEPDSPMYSNFSMRELGLDELEQLIAGASEARDKRLSGEPFEEDTVPVYDANDIPETEEAPAAAAGSCGYRKYTGRMSGSNLCFCQLAGNAGCKGTRCACPQGCRGVTWRNGQTVTFKNRARAQGCHPNTVLLTASKSYYSTTRDLRNSCGGAAAGLLAAMLRDSWDHYQSKVGRGAVNQCFHSPNVASVKYLHLQTFCAGGEFHAMPTGNRKNGVGFCVTMSSKGQAGSLAGKLARWL